MTNATALKATKRAARTARSLHRIKSIIRQKNEACRKYAGTLRNGDFTNNAARAEYGRLQQAYACAYIRFTKKGY